MSLAEPPESKLSFSLGAREARGSMSCYRVHPVRFSEGRCQSTAWGFRDRGFPIAKARGAFRVVGLGDDQPKRPKPYAWHYPESGIPTRAT